MSRTLGLVLAAPIILAIDLSAKPQSAQSAQPAQTVAPVQGAQPPQVDPYVIDQAFTRDTVPVGTPGLQFPKVIREVKPTYTPLAMRRKIQGEVVISVRVGKNGTVEDLRVVESLDRGGLDEEAMRAARQHVFVPATVNGVPVTHIVQLTLRFSLG
jgi:protein TonB